MCHFQLSSNPEGGCAEHYKLQEGALLCCLTCVSCCTAQYHKTSHISPFIRDICDVLSCPDTKYASLKSQNSFLDTVYCFMRKNVLYGIMCDESLMHRSPWDEYWSKGSTTTPIPPPLPNKYINDYYNNNSEDNSYPGSTSSSGTKSLFDLNQYFTQSTTSSPYPFNTQNATTRTPLSFRIFASYSTTRNPYDFRNLNHYTSTRNTNNQASDSIIFPQNNYNQYYSSTTTKYPYVEFNYYSTTAKPENTSNSVYKQPYNNYYAFTTPSTTTTKKFHTFYFPSASQNSPSIISDMNIEASVSNGK